MSNELLRWRKEASSEEWKRLMDLPSMPLHLTIIVSQDLARCYAGAAGVFKNHRSQPVAGKLTKSSMLRCL